jgi:hypothetical protein
LPARDGSARGTWKLSTFLLRAASSLCSNRTCGAARSGGGAPGGPAGGPAPPWAVRRWTAAGAATCVPAQRRSFLVPSCSGFRCCRCAGYSSGRPGSPHTCSSRRRHPPIAPSPRRRHCHSTAATANWVHMPAAAAVGRPSAAGRAAGRAAGQVLTGPRC